VCAKCEEIDDVIAHYRELEMRVTDEQTLEGLAKLIERLEAEKAALHPQPDEKSD
jgi:hypothetical protein